MHHGFLIIDKPRGISSNAVLSQLKRSLPKKNRVGYIGTLDPEATGVLAVALGEATKVIEYIEKSEKEYFFRMKFGQASDTLDLEGELEIFEERMPSAEELLAILPGFFGVGEQLPPAYSALKVGGVRAYKLARAGKEIEFKPRRIKIFELSLVEDLGEGEFELKVRAESGFYVRSLVRDLAEKLGLHAVTTMIRRTMSGAFSIGDAILLEKAAEILHNEEESQAMGLLPLDFCLDDIPAVSISCDQAKCLKNGGQVKGFTDETEPLTRVYEANQLIAMAKLCGGVLAPLKVFNY